MAATINTTTTTTTTSYNAKMMLYIAVIVAVLTPHFLSVEAIQCHQCNSHLYEDCTDLRLNTPRAQRDDQFLKECEVENNANAFCRKVVLQMEVTGEKRIVRECGWILDKSANESGASCHTAEQVGYKQTICVCSEDGCNGSPSLTLSKWTVASVGALSFAVAAVLRWN